MLQLFLLQLNYKTNPITIKIRIRERAVFSILINFSVSNLFFPLSLAKAFSDFFSLTIPLHEILIRWIHCISVYILCVYLSFICKSKNFLPPPPEPIFAPLGITLPSLKILNIYWVVAYASLSITIKNSRTAIQLSFVVYYMSFDRQN